MSHDADLAERLEAQAKMATQSVTYWEKRGADIRAQDESRLAAHLREAASRLRTTTEGGEGDE